jgi:hypothetical protein
MHAYAPHPALTSGLFYLDLVFVCDPQVIHSFLLAICTYTSPLCVLLASFRKETKTAANGLKNSLRGHVIRHMHPSLINVQNIVY